MRRSRRTRGVASKYVPKNDNVNKYTNHLGSKLEYKNQSDFINDAVKTSPALVALHDQKNEPFCALFSIVTAVEIAQRRKWSNTEKQVRTAFCNRYGLQSGAALERTLGAYSKVFPDDMIYSRSFSAEKTYGSANDLMAACRRGVVICTLSCADVDKQYIIHERKHCHMEDWHAITCVAYIKINGDPCFAFKDTNNRPGNRANIVFLKASAFTDAELLIQEKSNGDVFKLQQAQVDVSKEIIKNNLLVMSEMYVISAIKSKLLF